MVRSGLVLDKIAMLERRQQRGAAAAAGAGAAAAGPTGLSYANANSRLAVPLTATPASKEGNHHPIHNNKSNGNSSNNNHHHNNSNNNSSEECSSDENSTSSGSGSGSGSGSDGSSCCTQQSHAHAHEQGPGDDDSATVTSASGESVSESEESPPPVARRPAPAPEPAPAPAPLHKLRRAEHAPVPAPAPLVTRKPPSCSGRRRVHSSHENLCSSAYQQLHDDALVARSVGGHGSLDRASRRHARRHHRDVKTRSAHLEWCCAPPAPVPDPHCCARHWCDPHGALRPYGPPYAACSCCSCSRLVPKSDGDERVRRLQAENERLQLQTAVLSERIDVQMDKMGELEAALADRKRSLQQAEDQLQREMLSRSSLETQKLELLSSVTELKRQLVALTRENTELRAVHRPPAGPGGRTYCPSPALLRDASPCPTGSPLHRVTGGAPGSGLEHAESYREIRDLTRDIPPPRTPPATYRQRVQQYHSLPRDRERDREPHLTGSGGSPAEGCCPRAGDPPSQTTAANGTSNNGVIAKKADAERVVIQDETDKGLGLSLSPQPSPSLSLSKSKGIKKILGRMKRSGSGNLDDLGDGEFRRGGVRATASARLGWSSSSNALSARSQPQVPFTHWDREAVSEWLCSLGLEHCAQEGRGWIVSGAQLLSASPHDLEKELGIKNPLHRKKLRLALQERTDTGLACDPQLGLAGHLDTSWVLRWLDDTGLPQLKEQFGAARVDGRMLHRLTVDDLATLHVTSLLHVASLRTGIRVLRDNGFDANCLVRRSAPSEVIENGEDKNGGNDNIDTPSIQNREVALWTNHRVMEWLRVVDLAEYAPNLRGSGVHGGLMVHEPRFNAELLASLLSIPPSKTLLRRHLNTHFKELLGKVAIQAKRQAEATLGYTPLTPTAKIKVPKKSQFSLKRQKTKSELEFGDLVCPLDNTPTTVVEISTGDRGLGDGTSAVHPKLLVACPESDVPSNIQDSHSGRISTV